MSVESLEEWRKKLAKRMSAESQSNQNTQQEEHGLTRTDEEIEKLAMVVIARKTKEVLEAAWQGTFTTKSDIARSHADWVALACSLGYITVLVNDHAFSRHWLITEDGLAALNEIEFLLGEHDYEH